MITVNGTAASRLHAYASAWGNWWLDVDLLDPAELTGSVTAEIADITAKGYIVAGGPFNGSAMYRIAGGAGGWGKVIKRKAYADDLGVKVASVLRDAASDAGESISGLPATRIGPHFAREESTAFEVLNALAPSNWYVDWQGATQVGQRPVVAYAGDGQRTRIDPAGRIVEVTTEQISALVPGVTVDGGSPAQDIEIIASAKGGVKVKLYAGDKPSRRMQAWRALLHACDPWARYRAMYEYRVVSMSGKRCNLQIVRVSSGMPDLLRVPVRPGTAGLDARVTPGEKVIVSFLDGDPSRPCVTNHDDPDSPAWMPQELWLGDSPRLGVVRLSDTVQAGPFAGVTTSASSRVKAGI